MSIEPKKYDVGTVEDQGRNDRLCLIYESYIYEGKECGYNFHSLVWENKQNDLWRLQKELTREAFEAACINPRWVSKLHSFDARSGHAIVQVAEGDAPKGASEIRFHYSWRRWDLNNNQEVEFLQKCEDPFQPYDSSNNGS